MNKSWTSIAVFTLVVLIVSWGTVKSFTALGRYLERQRHYAETERIEQDITNAASVSRFFVVHRLALEFLDNGAMSVSRGCVVEDTKTGNKILLVIVNGRIMVATPFINSGFPLNQEDKP